MTKNRFNVFIAFMDLTCIKYSGTKKILCYLFESNLQNFKIIPKIGFTFFSRMRLDNKSAMFYFYDVMMTKHLTLFLDVILFIISQRENKLRKN